MKTQNIKPILFSTEMVQAILEGRKTMTRRVVKANPRVAKTAQETGKILADSKELAKHFSNLKIGDILWVRENFCGIVQNDDSVKYHYEASSNWALDKAMKLYWKPSIHMPKKACRIFLQVTDVRVERLQDISEEDSDKEGVYSICIQHPEWDGDSDECRKSFKTLWQKINGEKNTWESNPFVWVYTFKIVEKPENFI